MDRVTRTLDRDDIAALNQARENFESHLLEHREQLENVPDWTNDLLSLSPRSSDLNRRANELLAVFSEAKDLRGEGVPGAEDELAEAAEALAEHYRRNPELVAESALHWSYYHEAQLVEADLDRGR